MSNQTEKALSEHLKPLVKSVARKVVHRLAPWMETPETSSAPPPPAPQAAPDLTSAVWTLPDRPLRNALPPVAELLRTHHAGQPLHDVIRGLFGADDGTLQTRLLQALSEEQLRAYVASDTAPVPRTEDRAEYFGEQHVSYWLNGLSDYLFLKGLLKSSGIDPESHFRFLDFACSSGRVLRHFIAHSPKAEVFGTDIYSNAVRWMNKFLPPRGFYFQNSVVPTLPIPDASIDLVFCGSVFTHMDEFEESWLLEFRRVLRPGGIAFISLHTERTWEGMRNPEHPIRKHLTNHPYRCLESETNPVPSAWFDQPMPAERLVLRYMPSPFHNMHTFYTTEYIREKWGRFFEVREFLQHAHGTYQDGVVLVRRA
ncbi:class I SAM-dependent methyltransferase [Myxococcus sp. CA056]|nr:MULTISPECIES: class I SAM-dependent methyltransferase [Myxococcus]NTX16621.1 class I SAM-dependent methyltransferase [Myxococcus sp. CA056]